MWQIISKVSASCNPIRTTLLRYVITTWDKVQLANTAKELRQADYNQGRRYGNANGQPGAFGANTGFGGFGQQPSSNSFGTANASSGTGLFGNQPASTASPFGGAQTAASGFGGTNSGGGLFGTTASKPANSLFGPTNATSSQQSGGIFGTAGQSGFGTGSAGTGFGGGNNGGTGLFAAGNQQQAPKTGFSFSGTNSGNTFGTGGTNANNGGIFGGGTTNSAFGGGQQQQQAPASNPFGGFGTNQSQAQAGNSSAFGGFGTGNQQAQKPGGLFGPTNDSNAAGGGIFGGNNQQNNQQQPATGSLFGNAPNNQAGTSSLFGPKPTSTGTSLFGSNPPNAANNTGGSLFGNNAFNNNNNNNNQSQQPLGGLFPGATQQQQPKPGGIFGGTGTTTGSSLFNNNNNQQPAGGSLFGNLGSNSQPQTTSLFGTANNAASSNNFNNTQQPNVLQPPQAQLATLDVSPYGSPSIFYGLPQTQHYSGPVATPIKATDKTKKNAILPQYKINPNHASRLATPQKRGFGFTYSSNGTPSGASSLQSTPGGLGGSLLYNSIGRNLGKSLSTSNLRRSFDREADSLLTPGAFSAGSARFSNSGSMKKLTIDRNLRTDLFGTQPVAALPSPEKLDQSRQPGILKKKVSFDANTLGGNVNGQNTSENGDTNGLVLQNGSSEPSAQEQGYLRSSTRSHSRTNGIILESEMEQVKNNELAIVHEDGSPESVDNSSTTQLSVTVSQDDPPPGPYFMEPSREDIEKMSKEEQKHLSGFTVGREGYGHVTFNEPVDLTLRPLDDIYVHTVLIELRSLTVYPELDMKPPQGKGLNVPSTIYLKNSWPRQRDRKTPSYEKSGPRFNKHVDRLRKVAGTEFVRYEKDTGIWVFNVPHFTTYGFEYDDAESDSLQTSILSETPDTPTPKFRAPRDRDTPRPGVTQSSILSDEQSLISSSPDDTFEFRKKKILPGTFDIVAPLQDDIEFDERSYSDKSFLGERLASSSSDSDSDEPSESQDIGDNEDRSLAVMEEDIEMAGSFPQGDLNDTDHAPEPKPVGYGTPQKLTFNPSGDWADALQRTISPRKQDRQVLRENQSKILEDQVVNPEDTPTTIGKSNGAGNTLATSIDLMNSLFGQEQARRSVRGVQQVANGQGKGFEV